MLRVIILHIAVECENPIGLATKIGAFFEEAFSGWTFGDSLNLLCPPGKEFLDGSSEKRITCQADGKWSIPTIEHEIICVGMNSMILRGESN